MPVLDIDGARVALRAGRPEELLGVAECGWLDVKSGVYRLDDPASAEELAKDVAAFANTKTGGLLLIGFSTRKEHDAEVIDQVRPVPRGLVDLDRHRKLIRERVIPAPREVVVEWIDREDGKGILQVDVPAQPPARLPYVVSGAGQAPGGSRITVAVPIREGDATVWLSQAEIQGLLSVGWANVGGPSDESLRALIEQTVAAAGRPASPSAQGPGIGEGEAGRKGAFEQAHADLASEGLQLGHHPRLFSGKARAWCSTSSSRTGRSAGCCAPFLIAGPLQLTVRCGSRCAAPGLEHPATRVLWTPWASPCPTRALPGSWPHRMRAWR